MTRPWFRGRNKKGKDLVKLAEYQIDQTAFLNDRSAHELLGQSFRGLDTPLDKHIALLEWYGAVCERLGTHYDVSGDIGRQLRRLDDALLARLAGPEGRGLAQSLAPIAAAMARIWKTCPPVAAWLFRNGWPTAGPAARRLHDVLAPISAALRIGMKDHTMPVTEAANVLAEYVTLLHDDGRLALRNTFLKDSPPTILADPHLKALEKLDAADCQLSGLAEEEMLRSLFAAWRPATAGNWEVAASALRQTLARFTEAESHVRAVCMVVESRLPSERLDQIKLTRIETWLSDALSDADRVKAWLGVGRWLNAIIYHRQPAEVLRTAVFSDVANDALAHAVNFLAKQPIAEQEIAAAPVLEGFITEDQESVVAEFRQLDARLKELDRVHVRSELLKRKPPAGSGRGRVGDLTEMALLKHQLRLQQRHQPIRSVVRRAGQALQALKPCFMMGPLSVAQYLVPGLIRFDLVVFDEASQVRPEDALGAIARGSQIIVVGDPRQLPPTNFFNTLVDSDDDDEPDDQFVFAHQESILEIAQNTLGSSAVRTLNWHYRSRHEKLIAFSNSRFYDGRLHVFPTVDPGSGEKGLHLRYVQDGCYEGRANIPEAQAIVREAVEHIRRYPKRSLGIVAMNSTQARVISDEFDRVCTAMGLTTGEDDDEDTLNRVFIKNLENVQGDERDVMLISLTYGPDPNGHVYSRFGPINREGGGGD